MIYFEVVTTIALIVGVVVANVIRPGDGVVTDGIGGGASTLGDISKYTKNATEFSWLKFFLDNLTLQVLVLAIVLGVVITQVRKQVMRITRNNIRPVTRNGTCADSM